MLFIVVCLLLLIGDELFRFLSLVFNDEIVCSSLRGAPKRKSQFYSEVRHCLEMSGTRRSLVIKYDKILRRIGALDGQSCIEVRLTFSFGSSSLTACSSACMAKESSRTPWLARYSSASACMIERQRKDSYPLICFEGYDSGSTSSLDRSDQQQRHSMLHGPASNL